jgi:DNA-directed RNA polymerase specialized sigma24 family protein
MLPDERSGSPDERLGAEELRVRVAQLIAAVRRKYPRAAQQFDALWLKQFDGLDDETIARKLGRSVENVYVLRARALKKLRKDPELRRLAQEFGLLEGDA